jgi:hypothetical protein
MRQATACKDVFREMCQWGTTADKNVRSTGCSIVRLRVRADKECCLFPKVNVFAISSSYRQHATGSTLLSSRSLYLARRPWQFHWTIFKARAIFINYWDISFCQTPVQMYLSHLTPTSMSTRFPKRLAVPLHLAHPSAGYCLQKLVGRHPSC